MAVQRRLNCSPEQVFAVLCDGWTYPVWVVGASRMRSVDEGWPTPGTKLHHSFGTWPLLIDDTTEVLREHVSRKIGKLARPTTIIFTPDLPKTRSGKIMRRLLKDVAEERELGDVTTLADPAIVEEIRDKAAARPQED